MSIFGSIMSKIFGSHEAAAATPGTPATAQSASANSPAEGSTSPQSTVSATAQTVDVEAVLTDLASKTGQTLNWRTSIVDLMKLLNLDSSLANRKELAAELNYSGETNDSASMNIWLHKQVMQKLAANGGKVPSELIT